MSVSSCLQALKEGRPYGGEASPEAAVALGGVDLPHAIQHAAVSPLRRIRMIRLNARLDLCAVRARGRRECVIKPVATGGRVMGWGYVRGPWGSRRARRRRRPCRQRRSRCRQTSLGSRFLCTAARTCVRGGCLFYYYLYIKIEINKQTNKASTEQRSVASIHRL